jgi:tetratricopeptide (TPR) repeat protein
MNTKFNVLYNGDIAFEDAKEQLDATFEDDFWNRLPIEPLKIEEDFIPMPGQATTKNKELEGFEKAEEKAVKAIQKHSMVIDGLEKNDQIDEAYLLLGKSRYFLQRFVPALEAFSFALDKYPNANLFDETRIWKAKTHIRLQNEELAIETLDLVIKSPDATEEIYEKAQTALAMAYTQLDSTQQVIDHLKKSTYFFIDRAQSARNLFILGQVYREENQIDSSNAVFDALSYMKKIPQKYKVHATLERAKNYSEADSTSVIVFALQDLIEDRDNREYLDELYYQAGLIAQKKGNLENANLFYQNSVIYNTAKPFQKSLSYEKLGDLNFDAAKFEVAGAYYDSVLQIKQDVNTKRIRRIIAKNESLNDVILYENIVKRNDSVLHISAMPIEERQAFFQSYVDELKFKDEQEKIRQEKEALLADFTDFNTTKPGSQQNASSSTFYFYNVQLVGIGKQEFKNRYGNRPLTDNWIISDNSGILATNLDNQAPTILKDEELKYNVDFYLSQIPTQEKQIDSIKIQRNDAYYNLGLIYKEQFKEYELAAKNFESFLANNPTENLILPTKYQLYKTYANFNINQSNKYREQIVNEYPGSRYASIIENPTNALNFENDENSPEYVYKGAYVCYEDGDYDYSLENVNKALEKYKGLEIEVKFELLKAYLHYKTKGEEAFIERLNFVIANYPNAEEAKHAKEVLEKMQEKS